MTRRSFAWRVALFVGTIVLLLVALNQLVPDAWRQLGHASLGWLAAGLLFEVLVVAVYAALWRIVFPRPPYDIDHATGVQIALAQLGGFAITPAGVGGAAVGWWGLRSNGMPWRTIFVRVITHGMLLNIPFLLAGIVFGLIALTGALPGHARLVVELAPIVLAGATVLVFLLAWAAARSRRLAGETRWRSRLRRAFELAPDALRDLRSVLHNPFALPSGAAFWVFDAAALYVSFRAVGAAPAVTVLALAYLLGQLGNALPLPGGVGGVEPIMIGIFVSSGLALDTATAAVVAYRLLSLGFQGLVGVIAFNALLNEARAPLPEPAVVPKPLK